MVVFRAVNDLARCDAPDPNTACARACRNKGTVGGKGCRPTLVKQAVKCVGRGAVLGRPETNSVIPKCCGNLCNINNDSQLGE